MSESDECPLCMEVMEIDDLNFFPCSCGYQICRFCWHRIRTDENGLCPACRKPYSENPAMYQPLSQDEIQKIKKERKHREVQRKQKISESRKHLSNVRVIQKNLLFVVGLSQRLADAELLRKPDYFGKYGKIIKVIVNPSTNYAGPQGPSASAYITYSKEEENLRAILAVNNIQQDGRTLRVSLGTTKYCTHFLRNLQCKNQDCMYLHEMGDDSACFTKEDMQQGKHLAYEKDLLENFRKLQSTRRKSQEIEQEPQIQKEDWGQEVNEVSPNSALPAKAAWAGKESEKATDDLDHQQDPSKTPPLSTSWPTSSEIPLQIPNPAKEEIYPIPTSSFPNSSPSLGNSFPKEILHPVFATGWATSEETKLVDQLPPAPTEDRNHPLYMPSSIPPSMASSITQSMPPSLASSMPGSIPPSIPPSMPPSIPPTLPLSIAPSMSPTWPIVSDLGLKNLQVTNDDDLGFDPFEECNKGLADLLAAEGKAYGDDKVEAINQPPWKEPPPDHFTQLNKDMNSTHQYSLFGESIPGSQHSPLFGPYLNISSEHNSQSSLENLLSPDGIFAPVSPTKQPLNQKIPQQNAFQKKEPDVIAWQDGLRALLPNVNISFSDKHLRRPASGTFGVQNTDHMNKNVQDSQLSRSIPLDSAHSHKPPWSDQDVPSNPQNPPMSPEYSALAAKRPPPGFETTPSKSSPVEESEAVWSKFAKEEKLKKQIPPGLPQHLSSFPSQITETKPAPSNVLPSQDTLTQPVTAWNAIVGRAQQPASHVQQIQDSMSHLPLSNRIQKDNIESNKVADTKATVKPMASFNKANGSKNQKPTAKVKPQMKYVVPDDFPSVSELRTVLDSNSRSRMNDLDDISISDPLPINRSNSGPPGFAVNNVARAGVVSVNKSEESEVFQESSKKASKKKKKNKEKQDLKTFVAAETAKAAEKEAAGRAKTDKTQATSKGRKEKQVFQEMKIKVDKMREPIKIQQRPKQAAAVPSPAVVGARPDPPKIRILKTETPSTAAVTITQSSPLEPVSKSYPAMQEGHEVFSRLAESTEKLLQTVLSETEVIKSNTEQISKDLKTALEKCKESSLSVADLEKINYLLSTPMVNGHKQGKPQKPAIDTQDLERQVESARKEAEILEVRLNDVIRKNMATEVDNFIIKDGGKRK